MKIKIAEIENLDLLVLHDKHISKNELRNLLSIGRVFIAEEEGAFIGWLRYNLFWDNTPFMNMLYILETERGKGYGKLLVKHWEEQMKQDGYFNVMTSTASDEYAQHFYRKLGYESVGGFIPKGEPFELILSKCL